MIADHIRASSFLIVDGVFPSNEGRGYVLRRIIRRALRHGYMLGQDKPFFYKLVAALEKEMGEAYPELKAQRAQVERVLKQEEERFAETLSQGMALLDAAIGSLKDSKVIPGETVFRLYDTFGFPVDLTADIARERGLTIDHAGYEAAMEAQRKQSQAASKFGVDLRAGVTVDGKTNFSGYEHLVDTGTVVALLKNKERVEVLRAGEEGQVVLDHTPFYAESGGQVGDTGTLVAGSARFEVTDTQKLGSAYAHIGRVDERRVQAGRTRRSARGRRASPRDRAEPLGHASAACCSAQGARHARHAEGLAGRARPAALRLLAFPADDAERVAGSRTPGECGDPRERRRRDASHEVRRCGCVGRDGVVRREVRRRSARAAASATSRRSCAAARTCAAPATSVCSRSSARAASQAGVRRIEAVTGQGALDWVAKSDQVLRELASIVKASRDDVEDKVRQLAERSRKLEKEVAGLKSKLASGQGGDLVQLGGRRRGRQSRRDAHRRRGRTCIARRRRPAEKQAALGSNRARLRAGAR